MKRLVFILLFILHLVLFSACSGKKAFLLLPNKSDIHSVDICFHDKSKIIAATIEIDNLFAELSSVTFKARESHSDTPLAKDYLKIVFELSDGLSSDIIYVFKDETGFFIEQPYHGIFSIEESKYNILLSFVLGN